MKYILIHSKTLEEYSVEIPDQDCLKPEDFQVLVGENVYSLSPMTSSEVLDYRHVLKEIIGLGFNELLTKYPVKTPDDITDTFKETIAKEFDTIVETKIPDKKDIYMKHRDAAVRELTITFLNGATAWTKYRDTIDYIHAHTTAPDYVTDYTNQILALFHPDNLANETAKTFLPKVERLSDCMKYDERTHLVYSDLISGLDNLVSLMDANVSKEILDVRLTREDYKRSCPDYEFVLNSLATIRKIAEDNQKSLDVTERVIREYKTDPAVTYLITLKAVVYQYINDTDEYIRKISAEGNDTLKATYLAEYKKKITMFFSRCEFVLAAEARDTREKDKEVAAKNRSTMYAIRAVMLNTRNSNDEEWYKTLAIYFLQNKFEIFKDVLSDAEMQDYLRQKLDETHPLPKKDVADQTQN